ncbi:MAG TPA: hypothetical protein VHU91_04705 [Mycobacteriales bacterium]|jgi:hypothetical protein|nr:hypothetical protein [Mycobacteriales bacterium]
MDESQAARLVYFDQVIHDAGTRWMIHRDTTNRATELGYPSLHTFYFVGRGGALSNMLDNVDAEAVTKAMGWWEPNLVRTHWEAGLAVAGSPRKAAQQYGQACAAWGEDHLADISDTNQFIELAERVVAAADATRLPLFDGWRAQTRAEPGPGRLLQLIHLLREWRGGLHLTATTDVGVSPLAAILTNEGPSQAKLFGWGNEFNDEDYRELLPRHHKAETITNQLTLAVYERVLSHEERDKFADLVADVGVAVLGRPQSGPDNKPPTQVRSPQTKGQRRGSQKRR